MKLCCYCLLKFCFIVWVGKWLFLKIFGGCSFYYVFLKGIVVFRYLEVWCFYYGMELIDVTMLVLILVFRDLKKLCYK